MHKTLFRVEMMDCPSEENLIRMKLYELSDVVKLEFDIPNRSLAVFHKGESEAIERSLASLKLKESKIQTLEVDEYELSAENKQRKLLWAVLVINFAFFLIEMLSGLVSWSMGLIADSLDMLADSFVYGLSLFAIGGTAVLKKKIAKAAGYFQITLALVGFIEVLRRFTHQSSDLPNFTTMIIVAGLALIANAICLLLLQQSKSDEAHMRASMIFTSNDVIINIGVIFAGLLVNWTASIIPDLLIGIIVFALVIQGALRILKLSS